MKTSQDRRLLLARDLWGVKAVKLGTSGQFEINLRSMKHPKRPGPLPPSVVELGARFILGSLNDAHPWYDCDAFVGMPYTGDDIAKAAAGLSNKPTISLEQYEFGGTRCVASPRTPIPARIRKVLLFDDTYVTGKTTGQAIQVLADAHVEVLAVAVLINFGERRNHVEFYGRSWPLHSVFTLDELAQMLVEDGKIDRTSFDENNVRTLLPSST